MLDSYAVRKAVPRIVVAVVGINLSIYLCIAAVDITNVIALGISNLIVSPFATAGFTVFEQPTDPASSITAGVGVALAAAPLAGLFTSLTGGAVLAASALGNLFGMLFVMLIPILILALAILITVVIRQALLVFLIIVSPVAVACYVLPGTEKYFKQWWDLFLKTLLVYPIIAIMFALSDVFASILGSNNDGGVTGVAKTLTTILVIYAPLFLIPFAFKFAGGALSQVANLAGGRAAGMSGSLSKRLRASRDNNPDSLMGRNKARIDAHKTEKGYTTRGAFARMSFDKEKRGRRLAAARAFDSAANVKAAGESRDYASIKDDSDVTTDLARYGTTAASHEAIKEQYKFAMASAGEDHDKQAGAKRSYDNAMRASASADKFRDNKTFRRMALMEAGTIKYGLDQGGEGWKQATDAMRDISGGDPRQINDMMNQFQYVAPNAGRADLSGNVGGNETFNDTRGWAKQSLYAAANGHPASIKGYTEAAKRLLASENPNEKRKGSIMIKEFESMLPNSVGGVRDNLIDGLYGEAGADGSRAGGLMNDRNNYHKAIREELGDEVLKGLLIQESAESRVYSQPTEEQRQPKP